MLESGRNELDLWLGCVEERDIVLALSERSDWAMLFDRSWTEWGVSERREPEIL